MDTKEFLLALDLVCREKNIKKEVIITALEHAMVSAYKKNFDSNENIEVEVDAEKGKIKIFKVFTVVEEVENPNEEISFSELPPRKKVEIGGTFREELIVKDFGRIAAQTAKQIMMQAIKEASRDALYQEFHGQESEILTGTITSIDYENGNIYVNLGKGEALLKRNEQIQGEPLKHGQLLDVYILKVERTSKGATILASRTNVGLVKRLFEQNIPEVFNGTIEIKSIAREAGERTKIAVYSHEESIDAVGACVGPSQSRITAILNHLGEEKIEIIEWAADPETFIANALRPARVLAVILDEDDEDRESLIVVPDDQYSLAIGKRGQNARLAVRLTGWKVDIKSISEAAELGIEI
ncbi:transcription termination/antitermination protein NusA [Erysipelotrichaceae bacterium]|nr:transcription termination/antitermination protein NusA [Erysipelotrichaceae bacterium]